MRHRSSSWSVSVIVEVFDAQPLVSPPDASTTEPLGTLHLTDGSGFTDDATAVTARTMRITTSAIPDWVKPGMWCRAVIGIQVVQPVIYRLPSMCINDITTPLDKLGGVVLDCVDPSALVNDTPWERDKSIAPDTLQNFTYTSCNVALTRTPYAGAVPFINLPAASVAEFGEGRWDVCLRMADALGYDLRFTDLGDLTARARNAAPPAPVDDLERSLLPTGTAHRTRTPTAARVYVTRGNDLPAFIGRAVLTDLGMYPPPSWYTPYTITDRQEAPEWWNQDYADGAARDFLASRLAEFDHYEGLPILPAPWLQAGIDTVSFYGHTYWVTKVTMSFPSMETSVDLRRAD